MTRTEPTSSDARPVSLAAIITIAVGFALFLFLTCWVVGPHSTFPSYGSAEGTPADQAWQATAEGRRAYLVDLRTKQEKQAASYGWVDRKAGLVQLPLSRAMELVAQENSRK